MKQTPVTVSETKQTGETHEAQWDWVEHSVWTGRMLQALEKGVKGGVWFSLIDKVFRPKTLYAAWRKVKANKGGPGSDHQSIGNFEAKLEDNLGRLHVELKTDCYRPRPILRRYIDKPGSKAKRPLGIPCVRDRIVQAALRMVIEPIFERHFANNSYGFRPGRGCKDALRHVEQLLRQGYTQVVDADIEAYFDTIRHDKLMDQIRVHIADSKVLELLEAFLKQNILEDLALWTPERGTPQGAVISPLLSNLYLHTVDVALADAGYEMIRYADDFVIMCRSQSEAQAALATVDKAITDKGLRLHPEKTCVVDASQRGQGFDFLGYHFERGTRWPRRKSLKKLKDAIRAKTSRSNGNSLEVIIISVNMTLKGWFEYFKHSNRWTFRALDGWVRRRLRSILRKRSKRKGISRGRDHNRWPNRYFRDYGLFCLEDARESLVQSSTR
jgi:RNA-directed DNA polymerase